MYVIEFTPDAQEDLAWFTKHEQSIILDGVKSNLRYEPTLITKNRHPCRDDETKIADWELRIGAYRVFYNVKESIMVVSVERIGEKPNNTVELPILTMEELDAEFAAHPPKLRHKRGKNKTLEELMSEFEQGVQDTPTGKRLMNDRVTAD